MWGREKLSGLSEFLRRHDRLLITSATGPSFPRGYDTGLGDAGDIPCLDQGVNVIHHENIIKDMVDIDVILICIINLI